MWINYAKLKPESSWMVIHLLKDAFFVTAAFCAPNEKANIDNVTNSVFISNSFYSFIFKTSFLTSIKLKRKLNLLQIIFSNICNSIFQI